MNIMAHDERAPNEREGGALSDQERVEWSRGHNEEAEKLERIKYPAAMLKILTFGGPDAFQNVFLQEYFYSK